MKHGKHRKPSLIGSVRPVRLTAVAVGSGLAAAAVAAVPLAQAASVPASVASTENHNANFQSDAASQGTNQSATADGHFNRSAPNDTTGNNAVVNFGAPAGVTTDAVVNFGAVDNAAPDFHLHQ